MDYDNEEQTDALCPECGHAFKVFVDRVIKNQQPQKETARTDCPVCGCTQCQIG